VAHQRKSSRLGNRENRVTLPKGQRIFEVISDGCYIMYRKAQTGGSGTWGGKWKKPGLNKFIYTTIGSADDFSEPDGVKILDWDQATARVTKWCQAQARKHHLETTGEVVSDGPYTVKDAIRDYLEDANDQGRHLASLESAINTHILPSLGEVDTEHITAEQIRRWQRDMAKAPKLRAGKFEDGKRTTVEGEWSEKGPTPDQVRARKSTANRILAILKRALNLAIEASKISAERTPWKLVKPFPKVGGVRVRFLSTGEQQRLVNGSREEFRPMVRAALYTGSRYAPLCRMLVKDFNPKAGTVYIQKDKGGRDRHVILDDEAVEWFKAHVLGREKDELMFQRREDLERDVRVDLGRAWAPDDQKWQMKLACKASGIAKLTFHELRHTYASALVNEGVPLAYVAAQLGHADTRMVEKHYGHLCASAMSDTIRAKMPRRNISGELPKAEELVIKQA